MNVYIHTLWIFHGNISYFKIFAFILKTDCCQGSTLEHEDLRNCGMNCQSIQWIGIKMVQEKAEFLQVTSSWFWGDKAGGLNITQL